MELHTPSMPHREAPMPETPWRPLGQPGSQEGFPEEVAAGLGLDGCVIVSWERGCAWAGCVMVSRGRRCARAGWSGRWLSSWDSVQFAGSGVQSLPRQAPGSQPGSQQHLTMALSLGKDWGPQGR